MKPEPLFKVGEKVNIKSNNEVGVIKGSCDAIDFVINDIAACIEYVHDGVLHNVVNISFYLNGYKYYRNYINISNFKEYEKRAEKQLESAENVSVWESAMKDMEFKLQNDAYSIATAITRDESIELLKTDGIDTDKIGTPIIPEIGVCNKYIDMQYDILRQSLYDNPLTPNQCNNPTAINIKKSNINLNFE